MPEPLLRVERLRKRFGALPVTDDVTLTVMPGEIHALIGPNGAGKTTLLNQIAGALRPDAGTIRFAGADITRMSRPLRARTGIARTFQITSILPGFSVLENAALAVQARDGSSFRFVGRAAREPALNAAAHGALASVGLAAAAARPAGTLSHAQKRKLELAMAIAAAPRLLLLDEPLAGAGAEETAALVHLLDASRARFAMLLVEHDMQAVFALADRISVLVEGRLVVTGGAQEVRAHPEVRRAYLGDGCTA